MEINEMMLDDIKARRAEIVERRQAIDSLLDTSDMETVKALGAEASDLNAEEERLQERESVIMKEAEERAAHISDVIRTGTKSRKKPMEENTMETRNTPEYIQAYAKYLASGDASECRALLTTNATNGTVAVPDLVAERIRTAWENDEIMARVNKTYLKGNVKVGFEVSSSDAAVHVEGAAAPSEEALVLGIVDLTPQSVKKWITVSDEAIDMSETFVDYIYDELAYRIVKAAVAILITNIAGLPAASTATKPAAAKVTTAPTLGAVAQGIANLSDEASEPVVIINKLTYGDFKTAQAAAGYAYDPFEGRPVLFTSALPAYSAASAGAVWGIVGDLGVGAQANFPAGDEVDIKRDDLSLAEKDMVKFVGRQYVGIGAVAPNAFTLLAKASS